MYRLCMQPGSQLGQVGWMPGPGQMGRWEERPSLGLLLIWDIREEGGEMTPVFWPEQLEGRK